MGKLTVSDLPVIYKDDVSEVHKEVDKGVMFIHARCHPNQPLHARTRDGSVLILSCAVCSKDVMAVPLAEKEE